MSPQEIIKTGNVSVRIMELDENAATEWHFHSEVADFFVCLSGEVAIETRNPDEATRLLPGERSEVAPGRIHRVVNLSPGRAEYLLVQGVGVYDFNRV